MSLSDTIRAGQIAALERGRQEGNGAIASGEQELINRKEEMVRLYEKYDVAIKTMDKAIKELEARLLEVKKSLHIAKLDHAGAVARLSSCKRGSSEENAAASAVAKYAADVNKYQSYCDRISTKKSEYQKKQDDLRKGRDEVAELIRRLDEEGQNVRGAREKFQEDRIQAIINHQKTY